MLERRVAVAVCATSIGLAMASTISFADEKQAIVTTSALNIRSGPSTDYSVITKVYKGDKLEVLESSNGWYKIKLSNGKIGWGSGAYISTSSNSGGSSDNETSTPSNGTKAVITTSALNIRSGPSTSYSVITKAYKGDRVEILESSNGWHKIKLSNGKIGWGSGSYISTSSNSGGSSDNETSIPSNGTKAVVTTSTLNIRSGPSTSYSVITKVYKGDRVEILESSNGWNKVKMSSGKIGWGSGAYISTSINDGSNNGSGNDNTENEESIPQDKGQAVIDLVKAQLGRPYAWGAEGPNSFDCSGLTYYVYGKVGIKLPRVSRDQYNVGSSVNYSNLKPGDLLFSSTDGSGNITHVGIYIGNGEMIHSPKPGDVIQRTNINTSYWQNAHVGAKRVL
ncbi:SH3 domain-containing protein [Romboutsia sedimentorum]|uniref:SH3 domain-containing protein n=1 Tax=Romboutsia sedimentorum TaxID=1368474 RepID=A0ABT7E966_9FIRM|nr:C40 family peptidase [Romboutsia sedimentorum]MDK2563463.1 SH3 domain-containing protein [Romboutsia sedimentorum]